MCVRFTESSQLCDVHASTLYLIIQQLKEVHATTVYLINQFLRDVHIYGQYMYMNEEQTWHHRSMNSKCGDLCNIFKQLHQM